MVPAGERYVDASQDGGVLVATITREEIRDSTDAYLCRDEMIASIDSSQTKHLVVNLEHVQFLGSVGLVALLGVRRYLGDGRIILCNISDVVAKCYLCPG